MCSPFAGLATLGSAPFCSYLGSCSAVLGEATPSDTQAQGLARPCECFGFQDLLVQASLALPALTHTTPPPPPLPHPLPYLVFPFVFVNSLCISPLYLFTGFLDQPQKNLENGGRVSGGWRVCHICHYNHFLFWCWPKAIFRPLSLSLSLLSTFLLSEKESSSSKAGAEEIQVWKQTLAQKIIHKY